MLLFAEWRGQGCEREEGEDSFCSVVMIVYDDGSLSKTNIG